MNNYQFLVKSLAMLVTLFCLNAIAQEEQSAAVGGEEKAAAGGFLDADDIRKGSPDGLADLVDAVPGLQGELSQGETNTNLNVRGTQGGFNSFISLQEDGLPVQYSPFFSEFELRHDLSFERVEAVLGRPSGIFTAQGAAATINYISRRPTEKEGEANLSVTDYGKFRTDFFYGGPINNNGWYGAAGGFFSARRRHP